MKKLALSLILLFAWASAAVAQGPGPGPGPMPNPWIINGSAIYYNGCVIVPSSVSGGCKGNGTINAGTLYQNGFAVLSTDLANGKILVGNGSGVASPVTPSGDLTMTNAGVFTVSANAISNSKLAQAAAVTLKGNPTSATANVQDFTLSGLTALASPNTTLDLLLIWDHAAGTFKSVTPSALSTAVGGITALTGDVTATGPGSAAATLATAQPGAHTWAATQTFTLAPVFTDQAGSRTALGLGTAATQNTGTSGANVPLLNGTNTWGAVQTLPSPAFTGTVTGANTVPLGVLAQSGANTMLGNWTGSTANVSANAMPSCPDTGGNHLNYVSGTGITCGTGLGNGITALTGDVTATGPGSAAATLATVNANVGSFGSSTAIPAFTVNAKGLITAASTNPVIAPAGTLTGATLASNVLASSLTSVGTLTGGATGAGFTVALGTSTVSGNLPIANAPSIGANTALGSIAGGTAAALTKTQLTTLINTFTTTLSGAVPAPGSVTGAVLSDNGTWIAVGGTGTVTSVSAGTGMSFTTITGAGAVNVDVASAANFYGGTANKMIDASVPYTAVPTPAFSATPTFDFNTASSFSPGAMTANITSMTCNNLKANQGGFVEFLQDATGGRTTVYCSAFKFQGGSAPVLSTGANQRDYLIYTCKSSTFCPASLFKNAS